MLLVLMLLMSMEVMLVTLMLRSVMFAMVVMVLKLSNGHGVKIQIVPPVNIPTPTKIGSKMGGEFTQSSQNGTSFDNHSQIRARRP